MHRTTIVQLSLAFALSLFAGGLIFLWMRAQNAGPNADAAPATVAVVVASAPLAKGTALTTEHLRSADFLPANRPDGAYDSAEALTGRVLLTDLAAGEAVTASRLVAPDVQTGGVSALVAPGKRAVGVKGNKVLGLAGFVRPGNRVDVLVTIDDDSSRNERTVTKMVLQNIRVLASGTEWERTASDDPASVDTYTLELTPDEAERLALAATRGTLHFALRNPADNDNIRTSGTDIPRTLAALRTAKAPEQAAPAPRRQRVELITGTTRTTLRF
ncbi:Flp pilus assembly protein CpaB [Desulfobaculum sp. SPO524]|uniref:Flp pilus assembly protein CpaB n=1 Tax=Desulfobaculum sp. SPO524 TaxID=3378071 RepID=UPI003853424D